LKIVVQYLPQSKVAKSFIAASSRSLLDHFVRPRQHIRRNRQTDLVGCLQINHNSNFVGARRAGFVPLGFCPRNMRHAGNAR
jgi:hypothetical protein